MLVLADLDSSHKDVCAGLSRLKQNPATQHLPVIAFTAQLNDDLQKAANAAGATLVVSDTAILNHLPQFLDQALQIE
jgi:CheY-like chemotaxis protein